MNTTIKAVFFDVDATIYTHEQHDVMPKTLMAMHTLQAMGIKVGIATSRCRYEMLNTPIKLREFPFDGCIYDGGALVLEKNEIMDQHVIPVEDMKKLIQYAKKKKLTLRYSTFDNDYFAFAPRQEDKDIFFYLYLNTPNIKEYDNDDVFNVLIYIENKAQREEIAKLLQDTSLVDHVRVIEINSGQIDKSDGVQVLCNHWGIQMKEVMCFGDGANDVNLLKKAGIGVAMGNGCDAVKNVADYTTDTIDKDGVYNALKHYELL